MVSVARISVPNEEAAVALVIVTRHVGFGGKGSTCKAIGPPLRLLSAITS